ncbi:MAG TPA: insulinase family protein, partial [Abditibacteriaceae bacterium]
RYAANNLTLTLTGNYNWEWAVEQIEELCGSWNTADSPRELSAPEAKPNTRIERPRTEDGNDKFNRAHIALVAPGYAAQDIRRYAAAVACEVIGAGEGSRLYWALVHPGVAEAAQIDHDANDGAGAYYGYLLADPARAGEALDVLRREIAKACSEGLSPEEVERAKRRLASATVLGAETPMGRLRAVGNDWVYRRETKSADDSLKLLLDVTPDAVNAVLRDQPFERASVVALGPLDSLN